MQLWFQSGQRAPETLPGHSQPCATVPIMQALATGDEGATVEKFLAVDPNSLSLDLLTL